MWARCCMRYTGNHFSCMPLQRDLYTNKQLCCQLPRAASLARLAKAGCPQRCPALNQQGSVFNAFPGSLVPLQAVTGGGGEEGAAHLSIPTELPQSHSQFLTGWHCVGDSPANSSMKAPLACGVHVFKRKSFWLARISPFRLQRNTSKLS